MGFGLRCRQVCDDDRPPGLRFMSFLDVLWMASWMTGEGMHATFDRLGRHLGFDWKRRPSARQMTAAVGLLLAQRELALASIQVLSRHRREAKRQGRRQPSLAERRLMEERLAAVHDHWATTVGSRRSGRDGTRTR